MALINTIWKGLDIIPCKTKWTYELTRSAYYNITNVTNTLQNVFSKRLNIVNTSKSINIFHTRNDFRYSWYKPKFSWVLCEFIRIVSNMAALLFSIECCLCLLRVLRSADISRVVVSASILPDFASVFTSLLSDLETDLEFTDILFVLVRVRTNKIKAIYNNAINARFMDQPFPKISMLYTFSAMINRYLFWQLEIWLLSNQNFACLSSTHQMTGGTTWSPCDCMIISKLWLDNTMQAYDWLMNLVEAKDWWRSIKAEF